MRPTGDAVARLRRASDGPPSPLPLLVAEASAMAPCCRIDDQERAALEDPAAPIVLLRRRTRATEALPGVAPGSPALGVMLPASPLHHLLAMAFGRPLVATSGNLSGEPLCTDPAEAVARLGAGAACPIADAFLVHDRAIARPLDDSVLQVIDGRPALLRRARGYAPLPLSLGSVAAGRRDGVVALGGDLKCAPGLAMDGRLWLAPHLGDLAEGRQLWRLQEGLATIERRWGQRVSAIACDAHPGYLSHQLAGSSAWPRRTVPHHQAHALAVLAEHGLEPPVLAFTWDGLGFAPPAPEACGPSAEAGLWGGELLHIGPDGTRAAGGPAAPARCPVVSGPWPSLAGRPWDCWRRPERKPWSIPVPVTPWRRSPQGSAACCCRRSAAAATAPGARAWGASSMRSPPCWACCR